jgi:hypothetical protein
MISSNIDYQNILLQNDVENMREDIPIFPFVSPLNLISLDKKNCNEFLTTV